MSFTSFLNLLMIIPVALLITGGIFCLRKTQWRVCLASAWVAVLIMIVWLTGPPPHGLDWLSWVFSVLGTLSIIVVYLTKEEWEEIQDQLDFLYKPTSSPLDVDSISAPGVHLLALSTIPL